MENNYLVGNVETASMDFDGFSTDRERIKKNSVQFREYPQYANIKEVEAGETYNGKLLDIYDREYIFDIGYKTHVNVLKTSQEVEYLNPLKVGDFSEILIQNVTEDDSYVVYGSVSAAKELIVRYKLSNMVDDFIVAEIKELTPSGYNATIEIDGMYLNAFMPHILAGANKILEEDRDKLVGKKFEVCLESYSEEKGTYIINRKEYLRRLIPEKIKELKKDVLYKGNVTGSMEFGIFVEFNEYLTGMIYKTYISDELKNAEIVNGMEVEFYIKDINKDKIILTQTLKESLWDTIKVDEMVSGTVRTLTNNGILISIDEETSGMIRKSDAFIDLKNYQVGSVINVRVISVDKSNRKIFLTDKI